MRKTFQIVRVLDWFGFGLEAFGFDHTERLRLRKRHHKQYGSFNFYVTIQF